ncbi:MAG: hypothetical protein K0M63_10015 [Weeksellaceae bacterium]|nr:hypothetical protein [Weeksellaceae bacterium]
MSEKYLLKETAPFVQFSSVKITDDFNPEFDIEKVPKQTLADYCQQLINRSFSITHSQIPAFICHHCKLVKDPVQWLNKFEKLLTINDDLFVGVRNQNRHTKFMISIETKRNRMIEENEKLERTKPAKKYINAESEDRHFSFKETREKMEQLADNKEKIYYLTSEIYDYRTADIIMKNQKLPEFDVECEKMIGKIQTLAKLRAEIEASRSPETSTEKSSEKIILNGPLNIITNAFKQMMTSVKPTGKPYIQKRIKDMADFIAENFVDEHGNPLSKDTLQTYLSPGRNDKDPNSDLMIKF